MKHRSLFLVGVFAVGLALLVVACPSPGDVALKARALSYLKVANDISASKEFFSPKIQDALGSATGRISAATLALPGIPMALTSATSDQLAKISAESIHTRTQGKWGQVRFTFESATGPRQMSTVWVRVNGQWYVFAATDGEIHEYGKPPVFVD